GKRRRPGTLTGGFAMNGISLTEEQQAILGGVSGPATALALRTVVEYGRAFGARRLVPIKSAHLAGSLGTFLYKAYYEVLKRLVDEGASVRVPTTVNPRPGHDLNLINRVVFMLQKTLEDSFQKLGVTPNYSCVCYEGANVPGIGDVLGWAESSAVQYANSVLGARVNRNSVLVDLCSAVTGLTPEYGYLLDENRRARLLVKLAVKTMDAPALGFVLGKKAVNRVPVLTHHPFTQSELKNMGAAMAASGAVALFHVEGLTPEAPDLRHVLDDASPETVTITQEDLDGLRAKSAAPPGLVVFGCPHASLAEAKALAQRFSGKKVRCRTWLCISPEAGEKFAQTPEHEALAKAGVEIHNFCPLAALTLRVGRGAVLSCSAKLYYYLAGSLYGTTDDCLAACGA
ncbi:MAG: aconitase X, partial [Thermodesulfobacteriota bacterium]